jgi:hypothetical protein
MRKFSAGFDTAALVEYREAVYRDPPPTQPAISKIVIFPVTDIPVQGYQR